MQRRDAVLWAEVLLLLRGVWRLWQEEHDGARTVEREVDLEKPVGHLWGGDGATVHAAARRRRVGADAW